jgi:hypothetical protein
MSEGLRTPYIRPHRKRAWSDNITDSNNNDHFTKRVREDYNSSTAQLPPKEIHIIGDDNEPHTIQRGDGTSNNPVTLLEWISGNVIIDANHEPVSLLSDDDYDDEEEEYVPIGHLRKNEKENGRRLPNASTENEPHETQRGGGTSNDPVALLEWITGNAKTDADLESISLMSDDDEDVEEEEEEGYTPIAYSRRSPPTLMENEYDHTLRDSRVVSSVEEGFRVSENFARSPEPLQEDRLFGAFTIASETSASPRSPTPSKSIPPPTSPTSTTSTKYYTPLTTSLTSRSSTPQHIRSPIRTFDSTMADLQSEEESCGEDDGEPRCYIVVDDDDEDESEEAGIARI